MSAPEEKVIVALGLGNLLARDEGFGIHALRRLQAAMNGEAAAKIDGLEFDGRLPDLAPEWNEVWIGEASPDQGAPCVQFIDGGVLGLSLLPLIETCTHLLVLDDVDTGSLPGRVVEMSGEQLPLYATQKLSEHQVGFQEILALARFRDHFPAQLHVIGVQPADLSGGIGLSVEVSQAMEEVIARAVRVVEGWVGAGGQSRGQS